MTIQDRITEWATLAEAATEGPWSATYGPREIPRIWSDSPGLIDSHEFIAKCAMKEDAPDAIFMAASRTAVPAMAAALTAVLELHHPVEVEPSDTICSHCSFRLPNGRFFGKVVEWPCSTVEAIETALGVTA